MLEGIVTGLLITVFLGATFYMIRDLISDAGLTLTDWCEEVGDFLLNTSVRQSRAEKRAQRINRLERELGIGPYADMDVGEPQRPEPIPLTMDPQEYERRLADVRKEAHWKGYESGLQAAAGMYRDGAELRRLRDENAMLRRVLEAYSGPPGILSHAPGTESGYSRRLLMRDVYDRDVARKEWT